MHLLVVQEMISCRTSCTRQGDVVHVRSASAIIDRLAKTPDDAVANASSAATTLMPVMLTCGC